MSVAYAPKELALVHDVNYVVSVLSFFGSIWMIYFCLKNPAPRSTSLNILLAIACSDFVYSICNIMSEYESAEVDGFCKFEAFIRHASFVSGIYWTSCTAILCYKTSTYANAFHQSAFFKKALALNIFLILSILIV